jgi:hypothetical protein
MQHSYLTISSNIHHIYLRDKTWHFFLQIQTELLEMTISVAQPFLACPGTISVAQLFLACPETDFANDITKASVAILATV